ncbi:hypothetical protein C4K29_2303 [Pseudomonas chlororaphis subsp. piscium]|nr:hypothetical protein C4K29_2303 [Pseudomonas chlororaphis subsp. piscium]
MKVKHAARSATELAPCGWRESNPRPRCPAVPPVFAGSIGAGQARGQRQENRHMRSTDRATALRLAGLEPATPCSTCGIRCHPARAGEKLATTRVDETVHSCSDL